MINKVRKIVQEECQKSKRYSRYVWKLHIKVVADYAKKLARQLHANEEIAELGGLLHDIGSIKFGKDNHEITGQKEAEKILRSLNYPPRTIDRVKECIATHRTSKNIKPKTIEAEMVANADAMAHFDTVPALIRVGLQKENDDEIKAAAWVLGKLTSDWNKKLTIPQAKEMVRKKYQAAKLLLTG